MSPNKNNPTTIKWLCWGIKGTLRGVWKYKPGRAGRLATASRAASKNRPQVSEGRDRHVLGPQNPKYALVKITMADNKLELMALDFYIRKKKFKEWEVSY